MSEVVEKKTRSPRRDLTTVEMSTLFWQTCLQHAVKKKEGGKDKLDISSGAIQVKLTREQMSKILTDAGHNLITTKKEDGTLTHDSIQSLVQSYNTKARNTFLSDDSPLRQKMANKEFVDFDPFHRFVLARHKKSWSELTDDEYKKVVAEFLESMKDEQCLKFEGSSRGRAVAIDDDLLDLI